MSLREKIEYLVVQNGTPVTELSNNLTKNIDLAQNGEQILSLLSQTDQEIFDGSQFIADLKSDGLKNDLVILQKVSDMANLIAQNIQKQFNSPNERFKIILSGCGTSGRLGYLCSQTFSIYLKSNYPTIDYNLCDYIIAGDDYALVNSVESVEDKPKIGAEKLKQILDGQKVTKCVYIGITCGLSAPFVAGQIDYCLNQIPEKIVACGIIGFNPVEMTRKTHIINENNENFYDLMKKLDNLQKQDNKRYFIFNPLIGPEPVTGSSRMKSGTTTKILIDLIFTKVLCLLENRQISDNMLEYYETILKQLYSKNTIKSLGHVIDESADALRNLKQGGSINYLSDSERLGLLCCVDASECLPTYGAGKKDIKGFISVQNGLSLTNKWSGFVQNCTSTWSKLIVDHLDEFKSDKCVFILIEDDEDQERNDEIIVKKDIENILIEKSQCKIYKINLSSKQIDSTDRIQVLNFDFLNDILTKASTNFGYYFSRCLQEFILKLIVNAISTGAHILYGKTYENIMIDVKVSNIKLYWRACGILKKFCPQLTLEQCEVYLLDSIYNGKEVINKKDDIESHIEVATGQEFIVPNALVMAMTKCNFEQAKSLMNESRNSVRNCIFKIKVSIDSNPLIN